MPDLGPRLLIPLDYDHPEKCYPLVNQLDPHLCRLKVGKELFTIAGPQFVESLQLKGFEIFLDLKFHDIPNTVAKAVAAAASLGVWMVNVHTSGGPRMLAAAADALSSFQKPPLLIGVTILTSMDEQDLRAIGIQRGAAEQVLLLGELAKNAGLNGVVCSAQEAATIKQQFGSGFLTVTPGIRPAHTDAGDQRRVMTPAEAVRNGADYLVVGRPITQAPDPFAASKAIVEDIQQAARENS